MKRAIFALLAVLAFCGTARAQGYLYSQPILNSRGLPLPGASAAVCTTIATTAAAVSSNLATLTMASNPLTAGFTPGGSITVTNFTGADTYFNGVYTVASVTTTQIIYSLVHGNASASSNGNVVQKGTASTACAPLATIYTDGTTLASSPNPFTTDGNGNLSFWAIPGPYFAFVYGPTVNPTLFSVSAPCMPASSGCSGATWATLTGGTNTSMAAVCGTGCSVTTSGTGTIGATSCPPAGGVAGHAIVFDGSGKCLDSGAAPILSQNVILATAYSPKFDTQMINGCTWTATIGTITCSSGPFVVGDVGKTDFGTYNCQGGNPPQCYASIPEGTITGYISATQVTVSVAPTTSGTSGGGVTTAFIWGHIDLTTGGTGPIANAVAALKTAIATWSGAAALQFPCGMTMIESMPFNFPSANVRPFDIGGCGNEATTFVLTPNFAYSTHGIQGAVCIEDDNSATGNAQSYGVQDHFHDINFFGGGEDATGQNLLGYSCIYGIYAHKFSNILVEGLNWNTATGDGTTDFTGVINAGADFEHVTSYASGYTDCKSITGPGNTVSRWIASSCAGSAGAGLECKSGQGFSSGGIYQSGPGGYTYQNTSIWLPHGSTCELDSVGDFASTVGMDGGTLHLTSTGDLLVLNNGCPNGFSLCTGTGGTLTLKDTTITTNALFLAGRTIDLGGNVYPSGQPEFNVGGYMGALTGALSVIGLQVPSNPQSTSAAYAKNFGATFSASNLLDATTSSANSSYLVNVYTVQSLLGVGCGAGSNTVAVTLAYTDPLGKSQTAVAPTLTISANGTVGNNSITTLPIAIELGTAVTYTTASALVSAGCSTTPQYTIYFKVN